MGLVDNLDEFNWYPWSSVSWRYTYRSLSEVIRGQVTHYRVRLAEAKAEGETYSYKYNLDGFPLAFQVYMRVCKYLILIYYGIWYMLGYTIR